MKPGDQVEVNKVLAGCAPGYGQLLRRWCNGYIVESIDGDDIMVMDTTPGDLAGVVTRWPRTSVRLATTEHKS